MSKISREKTEIVEELHKPIRIHFPRRKIKVYGVGESLQADLIHLKNLKKENRGYCYMLTCIDTFSKYAFAIPLKTKSATEVTNAFHKILKTYKYRKFVKNLCVDEGTEFYNSEFKNLMKANQINMFSVHSKIKSSIIERFNRTLKNAMFKNFHLISKFNWIDHYEKIIETYNSKIHSTIKLQPNKVNKSNEKRILKDIYHKNSIKRSINTPYKLGQFVRIADVGNAFRRGFQPNYSTEVYKIVKINNTFPVTYKIADSADNVLTKSYYKEEFTSVKNKDAYLIENIIRKQGDKALVRWLGFSSSYDSWIPLRDIY